MWDEVIQEVGASKIYALVTDNAANMKAAWQMIKHKYVHITAYGCVAHGLNLLAKDIAKLPSVATSISETKQIIQYFSNKHVPKHVFLNIQKERVETGRNISLKVPIETRWSTYFIALDSVLKNKEILQASVFDI